MQVPELSVVIPVYNAGKYLEVAISSILTQSFQDFELLIINDGSTDNSQDIIDRFLVNSKVRGINNGKNLGLIATLNIGIGHARGRFIARMDADDICLPGRFTKQVAFMKENKDVALTGGSVICFFGDYDLNQYFPLNPDAVKAEALFNCPFSHPTVMIRRGFLLKHNLRYEEAFKYAEDYALWQKTIQKAKACNLPYFFVKYRVLPTGQTGRAGRDEHERFTIISSIQQIGLEKLGVVNSEQEKKLHYLLSLSDRLATISFSEFPVRTIYRYLNKLLEKNALTGYCDPRELEMILGKIWVKIFLINRQKLNWGEYVYILRRSLFLWGTAGLIRMRFIFLTRFN